MSLHAQRGYKNKHSRLTIATPSNFFATLFNHVPVPPPDRDPPVAAADPDPEEEITDMDEASRDTSSRPTAPPAPPSWTTA